MTQTIKIELYVSSEDRGLGDGFDVVDDSHICLEEAGDIFVATSWMFKKGSMP